MDGNNIIYLDRNENQYGPSPACLKELESIDFKKLSDYSRDYLHGSKSQLSVRLAAEYGVNEKNIILGYGGEDILKQAIHCYIHAGDKIMIPSMSWWYYKKIADEVEGIRVEYPIVEGSETYYYDIDAMVATYKAHKPKLVLISSPNNPTGNRLESSKLEQLLEIMKDTVVVLDEAYSLFHNRDYKVVKELTEKFPNLIVIRTFSKYHALAGLRIGFALIGNNHDRFTLFSARYLGFNRLSEKVAIAALDSEDYYSQVCEKMVSDTETYFREFNKLPGFKAFRSYANFILVEIPEGIKTELKSYLTARNMIVKFMEEDGLNRHIRITIGTQEQNRLLIDLVKAFLKEKEAR